MYNDNTPQERIAAALEKKNEILTLLVAALDKQNETLSRLATAAESLEHMLADILCDLNALDTPADVDGDPYADAADRILNNYSSARFTTWTDSRVMGTDL